MEYEVAMMKMEEVRQSRHARDHELAESLSTQLGPLRGEPPTASYTWRTNHRSHLH